MDSFSDMCFNQWYSPGINNDIAFLTKDYTSSAYRISTITKVPSISTIIPRNGLLQSRGHAPSLFWTNIAQAQQMIYGVTPSIQATGRRSFPSPQQLHVFPKQHQGIPQAASPAD